MIASPNQRLVSFKSFSKYAAQWGMVAVAYFITAQIGFAMAIPPGNVTAVWPPSGIALAAVMLLGYRAWPGIWLGSFVANVWSFAGLSAPMPLGVSLATAAGIAIGSTLQVLIGAFLIQRWIGSNNPFDRTQDVFKFVGIELISCLVAATLGATSLAVGKFAPLSAYPEVWWTWWLGDMVGIIVVTSAVIAWARPQPAARHGHRLTEAIISLALLLAVGLRVFSGAPGNSGALDPLSYTFIPFIVWAALRFGSRGVTASILIVSATAIWGTARGSGPFVLGSLNESLITLQAFIAIETVTGLALRAALRERELAEEALRGNESQLAGMVDSAMDAIITIDEAQKIILFNAAAQGMFGYSAGELLGQSLDRLLPERYRMIHTDHIERFGETGMTTRVMGSLRALSGVRANGVEFPIEASISQIEIEGRRIFTVILRDITDRKQAEATLQKSEERFSKAFRVSPAGLAITSLADGTFIDANESYARMLEYTRAEVIGHTSLELNMLSPEERAKPIQRLREQGRIHNVELQLRAKSGRLLNILFSSEQIELNGMAHALSIVLDITDRKQAEEQIRKLNAELEQRVDERTAELLAANKELEAFSYSVAHDLRAPLRSIDGFTRILVEDYQSSLDAEGRRLGGIISAEAQRMGQLIDDLLAFSRLSRSEIFASALDMRTLVESVFDELMLGADRERVEFKVGALPTTAGDASLMRQVWTNLLANAIKFTSKKERAVIEVGGSQSAEECIYYARDNGAGFDMEYADKLFGVFQRLHSGKEFEGTGVGLAIVQRVIHRHGGRVWAEGQVDQGAAFYFSLPTKEASEKPNHEVH